MALRIIYEGDEAVAKTHLPRAQNLMHKVREFVTASGVGLFSQTLVLDDSSYAYCLKVGDLESIYIFSLPDSPLDDIEVNPFPILPELYSGVVRGGRIRTDELPAIPPATEPRKVNRLEFFKPNGVTIERNKDGAETLTDSFQSVKKLAVEPHRVLFSEYVGGDAQESSNPAARRKYSQYIRIRPSNYTGRMQKLAQVVLGYGFVQPLAVAETDPRTKAEIIKSGLQMVYDFRWHRSHGLTTSEDGTIWLVEVSNLNGVIAMQLPMFEASAQKLADTKWADYQAIVNEFGGLPSGYGFPASTKLANAIKEGTILQLATREDMQPFFNLGNYSSVCGWAFNERGDEAHNTGWDFGEDGMKRSYHYSLNIRIGALKKKRDVGEPIATGVATLKMAGSGRLFHYAKNPPPFKYYEPMLPDGGGLLSAEFLPAEPEDGHPDAYHVRDTCDCPMFVYFQDDQLKVVNYYFNRSYTNQVETTDDYETCMYVGAWKRVTTSGMKSIPAMFYTTDHDDREESPDTSVTTTITGQDLGYTIDMHDLSGVPHWSWAHRDKYFRRTETIVHEGGRGLANAIVIPDGLRNGVVYALARSITSSWTSREVTYTSLRDPNWYVGYRVVWTGVPLYGCYVRDVRKVQETNYYAHYGQCNKDLADNGPWLQMCDPMPAHETFTLRGSYTKTNPTTKSTTSMVMHTDTVWGTIKLANPNGFDELRVKSPSDIGNIQRMVCTHSSKLGAPQIFYSMAIDPTPDQLIGKGSLMDGAPGPDYVSAYSYNYIGVP